MQGDAAIHAVLKLAIRAIALCLFTQILISPQLWQCEERDFPLLPLFENWPLSFLCPIGQGLYLALLTCLALLLWNPLSKIFLAALLFLLLILLVQDLNRLQVWLFQMSGMLFVMLGYQRRSKRLIHEVLQVLLLATYFWGGLQKFNLYFANDTFPWLLENSFLEGLAEAFPSLAYLAAAFELLLAIGLFFPATRRNTAIAAISFHLLLLLLLGPLGKNWNVIVWPWNILQMALVYILFFRNDAPINFSGWRKDFCLLPAALSLLLLVVGPLFSFLGQWPEPLSYKMYAGINPEGILYFDGRDRSCLPMGIDSLLYHPDPEGADKAYRLLLDDWAFQKLKVPPFVSHQRLQQFGLKFCECLEYPELGGLEILVVKRWDRSAEVIEKWPCQQMRKPY